MSCAPCVNANTEVWNWLCRGNAHQLWSVARFIIAKAQPAVITIAKRPHLTDTHAHVRYWAATPPST